MKKTLKTFLILFPFFVLSIVCLALFLPYSSDGNSLSAVDSASSRAATATKGGAIYLEGNTTFTMRGGIIEGHSADLGGAIYVSSGATLEVFGGLIKDNEAEYGRAIYVEDGGYLYIWDGFIYDTICVANGGRLTIGSLAHIMTTIQYDNFQDPIQIFSANSQYYYNSHGTGHKMDYRDDTKLHSMINIELGDNIYRDSTETFPKPIIKTEMEPSEVFPYINIVELRQGYALTGEINTDFTMMLAIEDGPTDNSLTFGLKDGKENSTPIKFYATAVLSNSHHDFEDKLQFYYKTATSEALTLYFPHGAEVTYKMDDQYIVHVYLEDEEIWRVGVTSPFLEHQDVYATEEKETWKYNYVNYNAFDLVEDRTYNVSTNPNVYATRKTTSYEDELISQDFVFEFDLKYGWAGTTPYLYSNASYVDFSSLIYGQRLFDVTPQMFSDIDRQYYESCFAPVCLSKAFSYTYDVDENLFVFSTPDDSLVSNPEKIWMTIELPENPLIYSNLALKLTNIDDGNVFYVGLNGPDIVDIGDYKHIKFEIVPILPNGKVSVPQYESWMEDLVHDPNFDETYQKYFGEIASTRTNVNVVTAPDYNLTNEEIMLTVWLWYCKNYGEAGYEMYYKTVQAYINSGRNQQFFENNILNEYDLLCNSLTYYDPIYGFLEQCYPDVADRWLEYGIVIPVNEINVLNAFNMMEVYEFASGAQMQGVINGLRDDFGDMPYYDFDLLFGSDLITQDYTGWDLDESLWNPFFFQWLPGYENDMPLSTYDDMLMPLTYDEYVEQELYIVTNVNLLPYPGRQLNWSDFNSIVMDLGGQGVKLMYDIDSDNPYSVQIAEYLENLFNAEDYYANTSDCAELIYQAWGSGLEFMVVVSSIDQINEVMANVMTMDPNFAGNIYQGLRIYSFASLVDYAFFKDFISGDELMLRALVKQYRRVFAFNRDVGGHWEKKMDSRFDEYMGQASLVAQMIFDMGMTDELNEEKAGKAETIYRHLMEMFTTSQDLLQALQMFTYEGRRFLEIII